MKLVLLDHGKKIHLTSKVQLPHFWQNYMIMSKSPIQLFWSPKNCIWAFKLQMPHFRMGFTVASGQFVMLCRAFILADNLQFYNCIGTLKNGWTIVNYCIEATVILIWKMATGYFSMFWTSEVRLNAFSTQEINVILS